MDRLPDGAVAIIFVSRRRPDDAEGYAAAAKAMEKAVAGQPGFIGFDSARGADGTGITVSYWADEAAALAWRADAAHTAIRARGKADWYDAYHVVVAGVRREYRWQGPGGTDAEDQTAAT